MSLFLQWWSLLLLCIVVVVDYVVPIAAVLLMLLLLSLLLFVLLPWLLVLFSWFGFCSCFCSSCRCRPGMQDRRVYNRYLIDACPRKFLVLL